MRLASRMELIGTETAFEVAARARALEATAARSSTSRSASPTSTRRRTSARRPSARSTRARPTTRRSPGIPALREAIAADADRAQGLRRRRPTASSSRSAARASCSTRSSALVDPGDEVIVPDPGYPIYESLTRFVGGTPVPIPIRHGERLPARRRRARVAGHAADAADRHQLAGQPDRRRPDPRATSSGSPSSPIAPRPRRSSPTRSTAGSCTTARSTSRSRRCPGMAERTIVLDGFSKTFAMTGWRLGYAIVPDVARVRPSASSSSTRSACAPTFAQVGAVEALRGPQDDVDAMVAEFRARRDLVVDGLNAIPGIRCLRPERRVLRLPGRLRDGPDGRRAGRPAAPRGRRLRPGRDRVRRGRREPHPDLVRELPRERSAGRSSRCGPSSSPSSPAAEPRRTTDDAIP